MKPSFGNLPGPVLFTIHCIESNTDELETEVQLAAISRLKPLQSVTWDNVCITTTSDLDMRKLVKIIEPGMSDNRNDIPTPLLEYHQFRNYLSTIDGVAIYIDRIIIPPSLRSDVLKALHSAHQVVPSMLSRAESSIFWPGVTPAII